MCVSPKDIDQHAGMAIEWLICLLSNTSLSSHAHCIKLGISSFFSLALSLSLSLSACLPSVAIAKRFNAETQLNEKMKTCFSYSKRFCFFFRFLSLALSLLFCRRNEWLESVVNGIDVSLDVRSQ